MVKFSEPTIADKNWMYELSARSNLRNADYAFGSIYCWTHHTNSKIARVGDRLLLRVIKDGSCAYAYPVGSGDITPAINAIAEDATHRGERICLAGVSAEVLPEVKSFFSKKPVVTFEPGESDYIYLADNLAKLSGKKYHGKKNHVNRFMAEHDWRFEPITHENISLCHELASEWFIQAENERGEDFIAVIKALHTALEIYFDAGFDGGVIWDGDKIAAFTVGEMVSPDTLVAHFEKANPHVNGAYSIINQQFAKYMIEKYPSLIYINREEDMGLENLRKAKQSYHPEFLVDKYTVVWQ